MAVTAARVVVTAPDLAQVLVEDEGGRWCPLLTLEGPDATERAEAARALVEAGKGLPCGLTLRPGRDEGGGWVVRLPDGLRGPFEALAAANGSTPEAQLARYLEADDRLRDLAAAALARAAAGSSP